MIPKIIHYCWFGGRALPDDVVKCIESWKRYCPDYEIREWNEENFDVNANMYISQAYAAKKFAFVSDYARFWILNQCGGVYFDTDVEVIKPLDDLITAGPFMGCERKDERVDEIFVAPGLGMAAEAGMPFLKAMVEKYDGMQFLMEDGSMNKTTIVTYTTDKLKTYGLTAGKEIQRAGGFNIYPADYFCPIDSKSGDIRITKRTHTIHHYSATWLTGSEKMKKNMIRALGPGLTKVAVAVKRKLRGKK